MVPKEEKKNREDRERKEEGEEGEEENTSHCSNRGKRGERREKGEKGERERREREKKKERGKKKARGRKEEEKGEGERKGREGEKKGLAIGKALGDFGGPRHYPYLNPPGTYQSIHLQAPTPPPHAPFKRTTIRVTMGEEDLRAKSVQGPVPSSARRNKPTRHRTGPFGATKSSCL